ncbi:MAG: CDP-alcohol phosphatidyltransferase family protein [Thermoplasmata archaeon]|nr:CDP-alcohol phosphatidyltransferase family protein [Thermoplasmata archaeon]
MVLEAYRDQIRAYRTRLSTPFLRVRPAVLTGTALALAVAAGVVAVTVRWTTPILFVPIAFLIFFSGVFDVLDGEVARRTGAASRQGDFLDHVVDRYADLAILLGIAASGFVNPLLALVALISLLLTSYMGTQAQAVGSGRAYGGLLTRADRLVLLAFATFVEGDLSLPWPWAPSAPWSRLMVAGISFTVLDVLLIYFVVAGQVTALDRARRTYAELAGAPASGSLGTSAGAPPRHR